MGRQRCEVSAIFAVFAFVLIILLVVLLGDAQGRDRQNVDVERFAARRSRLRSREALTQRQPLGGTSNEDQTFFEPLNSSGSNSALRSSRFIPSAVVGNDINASKRRRSMALTMSQTQNKFPKRYPLYNLDSASGLSGSVTRVRKSAGAGPQTAVDGALSPQPGTGEAPTTAAIPSASQAGGGAATTIPLGQMSNVTPIVVESPDGDQPGASNEGYTSLESPPEKVRVTNVGPFNFLLRWQKPSSSSSKDASSPQQQQQAVTYLAEISYVDTPGCDGPECAGNYSAIPRVQLVTKDNSSAADQQWMIGKNKRVDQGAVRPHSRYRVRLKKKTGDVESQFSPSVEVFTSASVPDRPQNVVLRPVRGQIVVSWEIPKPYPGPMNFSIHVLFWNGCPDIANVTCDCKKTKGGQDKIVISVKADELTRHKKTLTKDDCIVENANFMIQVQATSSAGPGLLSFPQNVSTWPNDAEKAGDNPESVSDMTADCDQDRILLHWKPPISAQGPLTGYEVVVRKYTTVDEDASNCNQPDAEKQTIYGPQFMNVSNCSFGPEAMGDNESVSSKVSPCNEVEYTVKDLKPGFCYEGTVVAIGGTDDARSPEAKAFCYLSRLKSADSASSVGTLIGGIIGGLVGLASLAAVGIFVWRRIAAPRMNEPMKMRLSGMGRTQSSQFGYARAKPTQPARASRDTSSSMVKDAQIHGEDNLAHEVDDVYEIKRKLDSGEVREEFDLLCTQGPKLSANERAFARTSLSKNRFVNVLPFEKTRVRLTDAENDYINASYVQGETHAKEYIATQAPKSETIRDFWLMVWQEEITTIAMVVPATKGVTEEQIPPGFQYWPKLELPMRFDSLTVYKMEDNNIKTGSGQHTVRVFVMEKGTETRSVTQLQFEEWPTVGVPEDTRPINDFAVAVRQQNDYHVKADGRKPPILVHCSAGTGRTGVVIALDRLRQQYKAKKSVDIPGTIHSLRQCRVHLVQTPEQYAFLYKCVIQMIEDFTTNATVDFK